MKIIFNYVLLKSLYIFFLILSLNIFFFSTANVKAKTYNVDNIEISRPFKINFDKNDVIDEGFNKAFSQLILSLIKHSDQKKIDQIKLNQIKSMIETFSIKEEKFIDDIYYVKLGVTFNKQKIFDYLEANNIFPSIPIKEKFLFIPIIIDENTKDLLIFSNNKIFEKWNENKENYHLIEYILPTEDLEDINIIKKNYENIEEYEFKEITNKYFLKNSIITLIFNNEDGLRVLSKITIKKNKNIKNQSFSKIDFNNPDQVDSLIQELKVLYEDSWKQSNQINTSIKLQLNIKIDSSKSELISNFEKNLSKKDLIYNYSISKFDQNFIFYKIIFNGTPDIFLKMMNNENYYFNKDDKFWILK